MVWTAVVVVLSLVPSSNVSLNEFQIDNVDKAAHFVMYTLFTLFWTIGLKRQNIYVGLRRHAFKVVVISGFLMSVGIEFLQEYVVPSRSFEALDLIANGIGCIFGIVLFKMIYKNAYK